MLEQPAGQALGQRLIRLRLSELLPAQSEVSAMSHLATGVPQGSSDEFIHNISLPRQSRVAS
jgi:hypothetical protein